MKLKALLRDREKFVVVEETHFEAEIALQEARKRNPEVIPAADLELAEVVAAGRAPKKRSSTSGKSRPPMSRLTRWCMNSTA